MTAASNSAMPLPFISTSDKPLSIAPYDAIAALTKTLNLQVVVEGMGMEAQQAFLTELACYTL